MEIFFELNKERKKFSENANKREGHRSLNSKGVSWEQYSACLCT